MSLGGSSAPRLLLLCTGTQVGGMEQVVLGLARGLRAEGWHVRLVFPAGDHASVMGAWAAEQGVEAEFDERLVHLGRGRSVADVRALRDLVRESRCDVVNLHYGANFIPLKDVVAVRLAGRVRCVSTIHHPHEWTSELRWTRRSTRVASWLSQRVVVNSSATQRVSREAGIGAGKLALIPCGVRAASREWEQGEARQALGLPSDGPIVGTLARLVPEKGVDRLILAAAALADRGQEPFVVIAGDGPERERLEALAAERLPGRHRFLGRIEDPEVFYGALDLFALPSDLEGFGLVYVEAALQGVPSVGTNSGGSPDAIEEGRTGILVPRGDIEGLASALERLLADDGVRGEFGAAARERARDRFSERAMVAAYASVLAP